MHSVKSSAVSLLTKLLPHSPTPSTHSAPSDFAVFLPRASHPQAFSHVLPSDWQLLPDSQMDDFFLSHLSVPPPTDTSLTSISEVVLSHLHNSLTLHCTTTVIMKLNLCMCRHAVKLHYIYWPMCGSPTRKQASWPQGLYLVYSYISRA